MKKELTSREQVIFNLLVEGISPKDIAYKLNISERTIAFHRSNIYVKLGVHSIQELVAKYDSGQTETVKSAEQGNCAFCKYKRWRPGRLIPLGILIFAVYNIFIWQFFIRPQLGGGGGGISGSFASAEKPLMLTLNDNEPWGYNLFFPVFK